VQTCISAQLMPLLLTVSCSSKIQIGLVLPFWYQLTRVVPEKRPLNGCVCVPPPLTRTNTPLISIDTKRETSQCYFYHSSTVASDHHYHHAYLFAFVSVCNSQISNSTYHHQGLYCLIRQSV